MPRLCRWTVVLGLAGCHAAESICARLNSGGTLRCWGTAYGGVLGDGISGPSPSPSPIPQKW
jgi:hypothetical protein